MEGVVSLGLTGHHLRHWLYPYVVVTSRPTHVLSCVPGCWSSRNPLRQMTECPARPSHLACPPNATQLDSSGSSFLHVWNVHNFRRSQPQPTVRKNVIRNGTAPLRLTRTEAGIGQKNLKFLMINPKDLGSCTSWPMVSHAQTIGNHGSCEGARV